MSYEAVHVCRSQRGSVRAVSPTSRARLAGGEHLEGAPDGSDASTENGFVQAGDEDELRQSAMSMITRVLESIEQPERRETQSRNERPWASPVRYVQPCAGAHDPAGFSQHRDLAVRDEVMEQKRHHDAVRRTVLKR